MEPRYYHHVVGGNFRLDAIQAAILKVKLPQLESWSAGRRRVADQYRDEFQRCGLSSRVTLPAEPYRALGLTNHHIYHQYVIRVPRRDELQKHLAARGLGRRFIIRSVCMSKMLRRPWLSSGRSPGNGTGCPGNSGVADLSRAETRDAADRSRGDCRFLREMNPELGFVHVYERGPSARTLLLLHGDWRQRARTFCR